MAFVSTPNITKDMTKEDESIIYKFMNAHKGQNWLTKLASVLKLAYDDRGPKYDERLKQRFVLVATSGLNGHIYKV